MLHQKNGKLLLASSLSASIHRNSIFILGLLFSLCSWRLNAQVGVGTNTPDASLDVRASNHLGTVSGRDGLLVPRVNSLAINGSVNGQLVYLIADAGGFRQGFHFWNGSSWQRLTTASASDLSDDAFTNNSANTRVELSTTSAGTARTAGTEFVITDAGRVGIGTAAPNAALQLVNALSNRRMVLWEDANNDHQIYGFGINSGTLRYQISNTSANHIFYAGASATASNELMRIQGNGDVGIGTTPIARLHVNGNSWFGVQSSSIDAGISESADIVHMVSPGKITSASGPITTETVLRLLRAGTSGVKYNPSADFQIGSYAAGIAAQTHLNIRLGNGSTHQPEVDVMTLQGNGLVGIGTTTPTNRLDVRAGASAVNGISVVAAATWDAITLSHDATQAYINASGAEGGIVFRTNTAAAGNAVTNTYTEQMRIGSNGFVGIGTNAPANKLQITHGTAGNSGLRLTNLPNAGMLATDANGDVIAVTASPSNGINWGLTGNSGTNATNNFVGTTDAVDFVTRTSNTERMRITAAGNFGIGTNSPLYKIDVLSSANNVNTIASFSNLAGNSFLSLYSGNTGDASQAIVYTSGQSLRFGTWTARNGAGWAEHFRMTSDGNFGIGTGAPNAPLQFANTIVNRKIVLWENTNNDHQFYGFGINGNTLRYQVDIPGSSHVFFAGASATSSTELMRIQGNGNVGIGTNAPANKLQITHGTAGNSGLRLTNLTNATMLATNASGDIIAATPSPANGINWGLTGNSGTNATNNFVGTTDGVDFVMRTSNTERMRIAAGGNVGVGTNAPATRLDISGFGGSTVDFQMTGRGRIVSNSAGIWLRDASNVDRSFYGYESAITNHAFGVWTPAQGWNAFNILNNGNIGIGTNTPSEKLHINAGALRAGTQTATTGSLILRDNYSDGALTTLGTHYSSGGAVLGYAVQPKQSATGFVSSTGINIGRSALMLDGGDIEFLTAPVGTTAIGSDVTMTTRFTITNAGNVGIGATTPANKLEITQGTAGNSGLRLTNLTNAGMLATNASGDVIAATPSPANGVNWGLTGNSGTNATTNFIGSTDNVDVVFRSNNTERMRMLGTGDLLYPANSSLLFSTSADPYAGIRGGTISGETAELLLFAGNDVAGGYGPDRVKLSAHELRFCTAPANGAANTGNQAAYYANEANSPVRMLIDQNGNVGVGTTTPNAQLQLANTIANRKMVLWEDANNDHQYYGLGINASTLRYQVSGVGANHIFYGGASATASNELMRIQGNGRVGIGTNNPGTTMEVSSADAVSATIRSTAGDPNGALRVVIPNTNTACNTCSELIWFVKQDGTGLGYITANLSGNSVTYATTSDIRLKEDIKPTAMGIKDLMNIQVADYHRIGSPEGSKETGFLAQQLNQIYPQAVNEGGADAKTNPWGVDYGRITPLIVKAVQDQQKELEAKDAKIEALESEVRAMKAQLEEIKALLKK